MSTSEDRTISYSGTPLLTLSVTKTGEIRYSARPMSLGQCEMVLGKMNELHDRLSLIHAAVEAERDYRAAEAA